ncbi:DENN domain and WD repeat-containing protein SCD1-like [Chenopodium quinoa]|uniref:DENN domain and WD repeat-containing protein SCD1-like n=1 Tax=Chenopodium quinoa TaxID=63459 RepID=UPI000B799620|nr:DENN domain and WD repeat-containing protein SCD1-like [Chenopodium quinoa]
MFCVNISNLKTHESFIEGVILCTSKNRTEVWDLVGDREDASFFISGSTNCLVKIWDPSLRGSELRATLQGHTGSGFNFFALFCAGA